MAKKIRVKTKGRGKRGRANGSKSPPMHSLQAGPRMPSRYATEQMNRLIAVMVKREGLDNIDDINDFIQQKIIGHNLDELMAETELGPVERAQALAYQAMDAPDIREMYELANEALDLDPHCLDAQVVKARFDCRSDAAMIERMLQLIEQGEQRMGREFMEENRGHFWGMVETRPYMRARDVLNALLVRTGRDQEAIKNCEIMLDLNPNDNQGIRDGLMGLYLKNSDLAGAARLLKQYDGDFSAVFSWGKVLERFLAGDRKAAEKALRLAHKSNPYVLDYLAGAKKPPDTGLEYYSPGSENEAVVCLHELGPACKSHPQAIEWLIAMKPSLKPSGSRK